MGEDSGLIDGIDVEGTEVFEEPAVSSCPDMSPASMPFDVEILDDALSSTDMPSETPVLDAGLAKEVQPRRKCKIYQDIYRTGSNTLQDEFFWYKVIRNKHEIEKFKSKIERNKSYIQRNKSEIGKNNSIIETNKLRAQVLKILLQNKDHSGHECYGRITFV